MRGIWGFGILFGLALSGCAMTPPAAPQPQKPITVSRFYTGRWYEIARTPNQFTTDCVAGTTDFLHRPDGQLVERDECRRGTPEGKPKVFEGPADILDPGQNTKIVVHYTLFGFLPFAQTYWMLDHGPDYRWFIVANPGFNELAILDRHPRPSAAEIGELNQHARALGFDTAKLEYPKLFPPGQG